MANTATESPPAEAPAKVKTILVLQRGWVVVGDLAEDTPERVQLTNASVIRFWGTTKGLGEIALDGPTTKTILDPCGTVETHPLTIVFRLACEPAKWT
jgi:hypothetical protein